ncbi:hypothetical protein D3C75_1117820 [compost metagenome]
MDSGASPVKLIEQQRQLLLRDTRTKVQELYLQETFNDYTLNLDGCAGIFVRIVHDIINNLLQAQEICCNKAIRDRGQSYLAIVVGIVD